MYHVVIEKSVIKQLQNFPKAEYSKIQKALLNLANNPRPIGYLKLKGREGYRIRVGNYRIIYEIQDEQLIVLVITIAHRKDVYD